MAQKQSPPEFDFVKSQTEYMNALGIYLEGYKTDLIRAYEVTHKDKILKDWYIAELLISGNKTIAKWKKRAQSLSIDEFKKEYGHKPNYK